MAHNDWTNEGDGWWHNKRPDSTLLVWHESWGGNKNYTHFHLSAPEASRIFASYKPVREWYRKNISGPNR